MQAQPNVFALLAAQVALVRDRIESDAAAHIDILWQAADTVARFAALLDVFARQAGALPPELVAARVAAEAAGTQLNRGLDELAFMQAQRTDLSCQMADGVVRAPPYRQGEVSAIAEAGFQTSQDFRRRR